MLLTEQYTYSRASSAAGEGQGTGPQQHVAGERDNAQHIYVLCVLHRVQHGARARAQRPRACAHVRGAGALRALQVHAPRACTRQTYIWLVLCVLCMLVPTCAPATPGVLLLMMLLLLQLRCASWYHVCCSGSFRMLPGMVIRG